MDLILIVREDSSSSSILSAKAHELREDGTRVFAFAAVKLLHLRRKVDLYKVTLVVLARCDHRPHSASVAQRHDLEFERLGCGLE